MKQVTMRSICPILAPVGNAFAVFICSLLTSYTNIRDISFIKTNIDALKYKISILDKIAFSSGQDCKRTEQPRYNNNNNDRLAIYNND